MVKEKKNKKKTEKKRRSESGFRCEREQRNIKRLMKRNRHKIKRNKQKNSVGNGNVKCKSERNEMKGEGS